MDSQDMFGLLEWRNRLVSRLLDEDTEEEDLLCEKGTVALLKEITPKKSSTAEHIHEGGEERGKKSRLRTGIAFYHRSALNYVLRFPLLYDLLEKCQPICPGFMSHPFEEFAQLAAKIADGELCNGLAFSDNRYLPFEAIQKFKGKYQEMRLLIVSWGAYADFQELTPPALTISLTQSKERRQLNLEQHVRIDLQPFEQLTDADHLALFQSIVMPLADEFKPDMVYFICDPSCLPPLSKCLGFIITCLMKLANGKLLVCQDWSGPGSTEVLLRTLLHDARKEDSISEQTLKGHASPATLDLIKGTTKKYGDHWPCLRKSDVYAAMIDKEYPAHDNSKEIFGADSGKGENSTEVVSSSGKVFQKSFEVEAAGRGDRKTTRTLVQEDVTEQRHSEMPSPTPCESSFAENDPGLAKGFPSTSSEEIQPTEDTANLSHPKSNEITKVSFSPVNLEEPEEVFDVSVENDSKLPRGQPVAQQEQQITGEEEANVIGAENGVIQWHEDSANLTSTSSEATGPTEETAKSNHPKSFSPITLKQLEEMTDCSFFIEKEIGPSGDVIKLQSYEIIFPANAVDQPTKTKFRLSFLTENLHLPANLIPIAHPIFCSPGKTIFKKDVTLKIPVWFKITDTSPIAKPIYVHLYSKPSGGTWEVMDSVRLGTSESIAFKCKHFCPILPCVEQGDVGRGEFTLDYFLCMGEADNFISYHCVSSDMQVNILETRMKKNGFKVIHPALTRQSVKPRSEIPVSLISRQPLLYHFESGKDCVLLIDDGFYKHSKSKCFTFELVYHGNPDIKKLSFSYEVGDESHRICCIRNRNEQLHVPANTNIGPTTASSGTAGSAERDSCDPIQGLPPVQALVNNDGGHLDGATVSGNTINMIGKQTVMGASEHQENTRKDVPPPLVLHNHIYNNISETRAGVFVQGNSSAVLHRVHENAIPSSHPDSTRLESSIKTVNANFSVSDNSQCTVNQTNCSNTVDAGEATDAEQPLAYLAVHPQSLADGMNSDQTASKPSVSIQPGDQFEGVNGSNGTGAGSKIHTRSQDAKKEKRKSLR